MDSFALRCEKYSFVIEFYENYKPIENYLNWAFSYALAKFLSYDSKDYPPLCDRLLRDAIVIVIKVSY